jgi:hypothetical protein
MTTLVAARAIAASLRARARPYSGARIATTSASLCIPKRFLSPLVVADAVQRALDEDLGRAGDITWIATIPETTQAHAIPVARQAGVIAACRWQSATFQKLRPITTSRRIFAMAEPSPPGCTC